MNQTSHQLEIETFMKLAGQQVPEIPAIPSLEVRRLRARLILEEALETIDALGFNVEADIGDNRTVQFDTNTFRHDCVRVRSDHEPDLEGISDGCADLSVVTIGTLSACGIKDKPLLEEIDKANLRKFGPGAYRRDDGKWVKPPDFKKPDVLKVLKEQGYEWSQPE